MRTKQGFARLRPATRAAALAALALFAALDRAAAGQESVAVCQAIADRYRALVTDNPKAAHPDSFYTISPLETLANAGARGLVLAKPVARFSGKPAAKAAAWAKGAHLTLSPQVREEIGKLGEEEIRIDRLPGSDYYAASTIGGTLGCYADTYFSAAKNGAAQVAKAPEAWDDEAGAGCGVSRSFASLDKTALAVQDEFSNTPGLSAALTVTPWLQQQFAEACSITIDYAPRFDAHGTYNKWDEKCEGADCEGLRQGALALAEAVQNGPSQAQEARTTALTPAQRKDFDAMNEAAGVEGASDVPPADETDPAAALTETAPLRLPLVHEGKLYLASAGHFAIGWRIFSDWSVKLQVLEGGKLQDKAIFAIGMTKGEIAKIAVK